MADGGICGESRWFGFLTVSVCFVFGITQICFSLSDILRKGRM